MTVDMRIAMDYWRQSDGNKVPDYIETSTMWPPRPIFTANGVIAFDFDSNQTLSIYNASTCDFQIQKMSVITSLCNTRCMKVIVVREDTWYSDDHVEAPIIFGNSFTEDQIGKELDRQHKKAKGVVKEKARNQANSGARACLAECEDQAPEKARGEKTERSGQAKRRKTES